MNLRTKIGTALVVVGAVIAGSLLVVSSFEGDSVNGTNIGQGLVIVFGLGLVLLGVCVIVARRRW
jgi:hypothetical protein